MFPWPSLSIRPVNPQRVLSQLGRGGTHERTEEAVKVVNGGDWNNDELEL